MRQFFEFLEGIRKPKKSTKENPGCKETRLLFQTGNPYEAKYGGQ